MWILPVYAFSARSHGNTWEHHITVKVTSSHMSAMYMYRGQPDSFLQVNRFLGITMFIVDLAKRSNHEYAAQPV